MAEVYLVPRGVGTMFAVPTSGNSTTPVILGNPPLTLNGQPCCAGLIQFYMPAASSISGVWATSAAQAATLSNAGSGPIDTITATADGAHPKFDIANGVNFYVTAVTGSVLARYL